MNIIPFLPLLLLVYSDESNTIQENEDPTDCVCDLTRNSCDVYCCCDEDCASALIDEWDDDDPEDNLCLEERFSSYASDFCVREEEFFRANSRRGMKTNNESINSLLCVEIDNKPTIGNFHDLIEDGDVSEDTINTRIEDNVEYSDLLSTVKAEITRDYYITGETIMAQLADNDIFGGTWPIPGPDSYGMCNDMNSARWMISQYPQSCVREIEISPGCNVELNVDKYFTNLKIRQSPTSATYLDIGLTNTISRNLENGADSANGQTATIGQECNCAGAVLGANYIVYTNEAQNQPAKLEVELITGNINTCKFTQQFSLQFFTTETDVFIRSGNPGYQTGKVVFMATTGDQYFEGFRLQGADKQGKCSASAQWDAPLVTFRDEMIYSCYYEYTRAGLGSACSTNNINANIFQSHDQIARIGKFGDIVLSNADDWVSIESDLSGWASNWDEATGTCTLPNILVYDIIIAEIGSITNPQTKIVAARRYFKQNTQVSIRQWIFQAAEGTQRFFNYVVFNYIEYDEDYDFYGSPTQDYIPVVKQDVLYPFKINSANGCFPGALLLLILSII